MSLSTKKIRSQPPDVIVAVGQGDAMQEFECYKIALSFASPYFDAMLSTDMAESNSGRISFPDKDPEEWKLFYCFIDPARLGGEAPELDVESAMILTKWFHEFQMETYLKDCDDALSSRVNEFSANRGLRDNSHRDPKLISCDRWRNRMKRHIWFSEVIRILQMACTYGLRKTTMVAEAFIARLTLFDFEQTHDLFDIQSIKLLMELALPLKKDEDGSFQAHGKSKEFWNRIDCLDVYTYIDDVSADVLDSTNQVAVDMLAVTIYFSIQKLVKENEVKELKTRLPLET